MSKWQRGDGTSKKPLAQALQIEALKLVPKFRETFGECNWCIDVDPDPRLMIGSQFNLPETASSWTDSSKVARERLGSFRVRICWGISASIMIHYFGQWEANG